MKTRVRAIAAAAFAALLSLPSAALHAQAATTITGKVTAETGAPIEDANVMIADLGLSVATNAQGTYTLTIPSARVNGQQVVVKLRAIGYAPETKTIALSAGAHTENFTMKLDVNRLSEVVVTGTAGGEGVERSKVPYAISRLTTEDIPIPALDPVRALQGKIAGVRIASTSGTPGSTPQILMRGPTSINATGRSQSPLIVVDGTIMRNGNLDELGGLDIESVEVVKGAAGATLYGAVAASGVINIKTKRGNTRDGVNFNVHSEVGFQDPNTTAYQHESVNHNYMLDETGKRFCVAGAANGACANSFDWTKELQRVNGVFGDTVRIALAPQYGIPSLSAGDLQNLFQVGVWPNQYYNTFAQAATRALTTINSLDASGRVGGVRFFVSGQYTDNQGAVKESNRENVQRARVNLDYDIRSDLLVSVSTAFAKTIDAPDNGISFANFYRGFTAGTDALARDTLGRTMVTSLAGGSAKPLGNGSGGIFNTQEWSNNWLFSNRFLGNITGTYNPAEWVTVTGTYAYDNRSEQDQGYSFKGRRVNQQTTSTTSLGSMSTFNQLDEAMNGVVTATLRKQIGSDLHTTLSLSGTGDQLTDNQQGNGGTTFIVKDIFTVSNTSTNKTATSSTQMDRNLGYSTALNLDYKDRYILDGAIREDGSSRFGSGNRWSPFGRISGVWRVSQEPFFNVPGMTDFRLRASRGSAGKSPSFSAQYETYTCNTTGCSLGQAGNKLLKPETTTETELGTDMTLFNRLGIEFTHINGVSKNQLMQVPTPATVGFTTQWQNAGTLQNTTYELALTLPVVTKRDFNWNMRGTWDRTRTYITELFVPEFFTDGGTTQGTPQLALISADPTKVDGVPRNRFGNVWAREFYKSCGAMPAAVQASCGAGQDYQLNNQGYVVWVGKGNTPQDGITKNLWQTKLAQAASPWNYPLYWGMPIVDRPLRGEPGEGVGKNHIIGSALPDFRLTFGNTIQYKKLSLYGLLDGTYGFLINNQMEGWSLGDLDSHHFDQAGVSVADGKPVGYTWRAAGPESGNQGVGGFYDILNPNNYNTESGSYTKLRELNLSYRVGKIPSLGGDWTFALIGRNMYTWTKYSGVDPEVGVVGGLSNSGLINQTDAGSYPNTRTYTISFSTRY